MSKDPTQTSPQGRQEPKAKPGSSGQAAAALKNQQRKARAKIVEALVRRGIPRTDWPACAREALGPEFSVTYRPSAFQPPDFEHLEESVSEWANKVRAALELQLTHEIKQIEGWIHAGIDEHISLKRKRGPGQSGRNVATDLRYEWAARRLCGESWKEIAPANLSWNRVQKSATEALQEAGWLHRRRKEK